MNCQDFELVVLAPARKQLLDAASRELGLAHIETCPGCANRFAEEELLFAGVRSVVAELAKLEAPASVEAALLAAFRERVAQTTSPRVLPFPIRPTRSRIWRLAAVAAAILILLSGMAMFWARSSVPNPEKEAVAPPPSSAPAVPDAQSDQSIKMVSGDIETPQRPRPRRRSSPSELGEYEVVTDFFMLVEGHDVDSVEGGQIVRVELPASAVTAVGLPGGAERSREVVEADVVLGPDGLARAIRFVRSDSQR